MPYLETSAEWYEQSSLLLKARPSTTRITSKYTVLKPSASKVSKRERFASKRSERGGSATGSPPPTVQNPEEPVATFKLKTYDPVSGTCLQYETNKAAEVGRLIGTLSRLGRHQAALPELPEDLTQAASAEGISTPVVESDQKLGAPAAEQKAAGGKKKKKGKK
ncbi:hypothetical protein BU24DRAFT_426539 [Aaosphaeria arxii CBS 175.79]|uniref:SRP9 domain-containing protein n=1 Tax=Aaosphaeria arxii CBS 175.79 TaxID=1450172 RepID=A0A6A5XE52_9PLEO|nr:uncharacterized protein BU24DRAFT_426539 [Aaosphaeria arxii CBS 175.79]KAF2011455.1 hypothetical protein BU24DRAFT_426539 [Aaosphaeria arxii CBS 175.79]